MFRKLHNWLKQDKFKVIHLCKLFRFLHIPIPPYFIGIAVGEVWSLFFRICTAPGDNSSPDDTGDHTWLTENTPATGIAKGQKIFLRFLLAEVMGDAVNNIYYSLHYDKENTPASTTVINTASNVFRIVDDPESAITDATATLTNLMSSGPGSWFNGIYIDASSSTGKLSFAANTYTEIMFCIEVMSDAEDLTDYYFFIEDDDLGELARDVDHCKITTAAAAEGGPRGPLGHPFNGPFGGPI